MYKLRSDGDFMECSPPPSQMNELFIWRSIYMQYNVFCASWDELWARVKLVQCQLYVMAAPDCLTVTSMY